MTGYVQLYVRFGLSPDLLDLMQNGQKYLTSVTSDVQDVNLFNNNPNRSVRAYLRFNAPGFSGASYNVSATDRNSDVVFNTVNMRNQAQTQQVEMQGGTSMTFALGFETGSTLSYDTDGDGLPDAWETQYGLNPNDATGNNGAQRRPGWRRPHQLATNSFSGRIRPWPMRPVPPSRLRAPPRPPWR